VEALAAMDYPIFMSQTLEQRIEDLEKRVAELSAQILGLEPRAKDWQSTFQSLPDDELTREAERLGREYRQQQTCEREIAGS